MSRKMFTFSDFTSPDPPDIDPCLDILHGMNINDQKQLVLCPGFNLNDFYVGLEEVFPVEVVR